MFRRIILFLFLLICLSIKGYSAIFVVTSNADSGPGTLREALIKAAANGTTQTDFINFNLPDLTTNGRTIVLTSQLPDISANIVIDGETQPGSNFGVSDAKVKIFNNFPTVAYTIPPVIFNADNVGNFTIRGLYLTALTYESQPNAFSLTISNSKDVIIEHCLMPGGKLLIDNCKSVSLKSNMIGYLADGVTGFSTNVTINNTLNVSIGGSPQEGNFFSGDLDLNMTELDKDWTYLISNNKMGTDYTGASSSPGLYSEGRIDIESGHYNPPSSGRMHGTITDNMIENFSASGIVVSGFGDVAIKGNMIGTDPTGKIDFFKFAPSYVYNSLGYAPTGIVLQVGVDAVVGGINPGDGNKIAYISNGILEQLANQVVISRNSIYCLNRNYFNIHDFFTSAYAKPLPQVRINNIQSGSIKGTATPGARVELFSNNEGECAACEPRTFFASVTANAQGNWSYNGAVPGNIVASAIYNNQTSLFTKAMIDVAGLKVRQPQCGDNTGAITGIKYYNAGQIKWVNEKGQVLSQTADINNLPPGRYKFKIGSDVCGAESDWIDIVDNSIEINAGNIKTKQPACNKGGAISGIVIATYQDEKFIAKWMDKSLNQVGNTVDIVNLNPGEYTLEVTGQQTGCTKNYGPVKLLASTGPLIDQAGVKIQSTNCGQSTGSITNITVTGTGNLQFLWWNSQQQQVGTQKDLTNQPAGTYKLQVLDDTQCGPIYTTDITIPEINGITLDESKVTTSIASCSQNNGSIKGISFTGATKFQWMDVNNQVVSNTADFTGAAPGVYTFTASNNFGCSKTSQPYTVGQQLPVQLPQYSATIVASCFGGKSGSVTIATDALVKSLRWVDGQGGPAGDQPALTNVAAGTYKLYITDQNGCENLYNTYTVEEVPEYKVASAGQIINDQCGLNTGNINNVSITGGVPPYTYKWTDGAGKQIGTESAISNLSAGNYVLNVTDTRCGNVDISYAITEESAEVAAPSVSDIQLCSGGGALLSVNNASSTITYRLYETENSAHQIDEQKGGKFNINVTANRSYFVTQLNGTCESPRAEVKITVGLSTLNIANAFTPNGDGINDYWKISNIESYPGALVQVFSRYGQKVFESKGYAKPFDGTMNGKKLPPGVYYYIINLNTNCNVLSGSLTIIR